MADLTHIISSGEGNLVFTDWKNIMDTKAIAGTQCIFQLMGEKSVRNDGSFNLHIAQLQC